jgi:serine/threonine-protein kinase ATR
VVTNSNCSKAVFRSLDYARRWIQARRSWAGITDHGRSKDEAADRLQNAIDRIPAQLIAQRAVDCKDYARALFHLEQHAMDTNDDEKSRLLEQLQDIYSHIDEPDGLEGISTQLHVLDINHQVLSHRKAGRWTAAQTWYEIQLSENPDNTDVQVDLLTCLKQSGQHGTFRLKHCEALTMLTF